MTPADDRVTILRRLVRYVPYHVVIRAARGAPTRPGAEHIDGSVLVADLSGFTALSEALGRKGRDGIDELTGLLSRIFSALLEEAVFPHRGFLVKFAGDALLVFFEGPDNLAQAAASAMQAQHQMQALSAAARRTLALRVGIARGPFDLVTVGFGDRLDCFFAGDAAVRALAAADAAGPGEIVLDAPGLARGPFRAGSALPPAIACAPQRVGIEDPLAGLSGDAVEQAIAAVRGFVAPELYERIVQSPAATGVPAERRNACAVFCELDGWTGDVAALSEAYRAGCEAAARHGGSVNKIDAAARGPRLLASFGIPAAHGDDERRAIAFALELRSRLRGLGVRVGLESGPVFGGEVGSSLKREFTIMGDTVNVAARLASAASPGQVLCGPECWARTDSFLGRPTAPLPLKGKSLPVTPIDVAAPRRFTASRLERRIGRPALLGRDRELAQIGELSARALAGEVVGLKLTGPAGIGKSALAGEAVDRWLDAGGAAFSVRCEYDKRDRPYLLFRALLGALLELTPEPPPATDVVASALARRGIADRALAEMVAAFLDPAAQRWDAAAERGAARALSTRLVAAVAERAPLMVVIEDAQHADAASAEVLRYCTEWKARCRLLVLSTMRPGAGEHAAAHHPFALEVRPLERASVRALLARALEVPVVSDLLEEAVEARARGNPLFVLRLAGWLASRGMVERIGGRAALSLRAAADPASALPPDLESLVYAEVDQLPPADREALRTVSVLGAEFTNDLAVPLCTAGGMAAADVAGALEHLSRSGLLVTSGGAQPTWRFTRLTDREVIYSGLPAGLRRALHARAARILADRGAALDRLAAHYDAADDHPNAARCCLEVARLSQRGGAYADALRLFQAAARHLRAMGQDATECEIAEVECLARLASYGEARELATRLADRLVDPTLRMRALTSAAMCASYEGDLGAARAIVRRAKDEIPPEAPGPVRAHLLLMCASYHAAVGQPLEAIEELTDARAVAGEELLPVVTALRAGLLAEVGRVGEAVPMAREACALARGRQNRGSLAFALVSLGRAVEVSGDRAQAREHYRSAQRIYAEMRQPANAANAALHAAQAELALGAAASALDELLPVLETFRHYASGQDETAALCSIGRARLLLGDRDGAVRDLEHAVRLSETTLEHHAAICGRAWLGEALWERDRARAQALLEAAVRAGRDRNMAVELAEAERVAARLGAAA